MENILNTIQDQLNMELNNIKAAGLYKQERIIQSQQSAEINVNNIQPDLFDSAVNEEDEGEEETGEDK